MENQKNRKKGKGDTHPSCKKLEIKFFEKIKNTEPSLSPLSSHFGILAKGGGGTTTEVFNGR
jgi:hypothetical protein